MNELLKNYTEEEKLSYLFQLSLNMGLEEFKRTVEKLDNKPKNINNIIIISLLAKNMFNIQMDNISSLKDANKHYKNILNKYSNLASCLNIRNSLELSILYSYLLWNGYFSVNNKYLYDEKNLISLDGIYSFDIMNGNGICINNSDMLRDFLNINGFNSAILINTMNRKSKKNYTPRIEKTLSKQDFISKTKEILSLPIRKKLGDHAFNLISDNENLYIYDSTNFLLFNIENIYKAKLINGTGNFSLKPYFSYCINLPTDSRNVLKKFYSTKSFINNYDNNCFIRICEDVIKLADSNKDELNKCYNDVKESIYIVSDTVNKVKEKKIKF